MTEEQTNAETIDALDSILEQFNTINNSLTLFKMQISALQQQVKQVEKNVKKELKYIKNDKNNDKPKSIRSPSGFAKPTKVTKELCEFMGKPAGSEIARTEATKALSVYIRDNGLLDKKDGRKIIPDNKLLTLLGFENNEFQESNLNYFNIQKYMNKHFNPDKQCNLDILS